MKSSQHPGPRPSLGDHNASMSAFALYARPDLLEECAPANISTFSTLYSLTSGIGAVYALPQISATGSTHSGPLAVKGYCLPDGRLRVSTDLPLLARRYRYLTVVGEGRSAQVILAQDTAFLDAKLVVIKVLKRHFSSAGHKEASALRFLHAQGAALSSGLVKMHSAFAFAGHTCLVLERLQGSLLDHIVHSAGVSRIQHVHNLRQIAVQLLGTLALMHSKQVVHADLKPENVLLESMVGAGPEAVRVKLIDLGNCFSVSGTDASRISFEMQTLPFRAPEAVMGRSCGTGIDIWSLGCLLAEVALQRPLFPVATTAELIAQMTAQLGVSADALRAPHQHISAAADPHTNPSAPHNKKMGISHVVTLPQQASALYGDKLPSQHAALADVRAETGATPQQSAGELQGMVQAPALVAKAGPLKLWHEAVCPLHMELAKIDVAMASLIMSMLELDPQRRVSASDALRHSFLAEACPALQLPQAEVRASWALPSVPGHFILPSAVGQSALPLTGALPAVPPALPSAKGQSSVAPHHSTATACAHLRAPLQERQVMSAQSNQAAPSVQKPQAMQNKQTPGAAPASHSQTGGPVRPQARRQPLDSTLCRPHTLPNSAEASSSIAQLPPQQATQHAQTYAQQAQQVPQHAQQLTEHAQQVPQQAQQMPQQAQQMPQQAQQMTQQAQQVPQQAQQMTQHAQQMTQHAQQMTQHAQLVTEHAQQVPQQAQQVPQQAQQMAQQAQQMTQHTQQMTQPAQHAQQTSQHAQQLIQHTQLSGQQAQTRTEHQQQAANHAQLPAQRAQHAVKSSTLQQRLTLPADRAEAQMRQLQDPQGAQEPQLQRSAAANGHEQHAMHPQRHVHQDVRASLQHAAAPGSNWMLPDSQQADTRAVSALSTMTADHVLHTPAKLIAPMSVARSSLNQQAPNLPQGATISALPRLLLGTNQILATGRRPVPGTCQALIEGPGPGPDPGTHMTPTLGMQGTPGANAAQTKGLGNAPRTQEALQRVAALVGTLTPATEVRAPLRSLARALLIAGHGSPGASDSIHPLAQVPAVPVASPAAQAAAPSLPKQDGIGQQQNPGKAQKAAGKTTSKQSTTGAPPSQSAKKADLKACSSTVSQAASKQSRAQQSQSAAALPAAVNSIAGASKTVTQTAQASGKHTSQRRESSQAMHPEQAGISAVSSQRRKGLAYGGCVELKKMPRQSKSGTGGPASEQAQLGLKQGRSAKQPGLSHPVAQQQDFQQSAAKQAESEQAGSGLFADSGCASPSADSSQHKQARVASELTRDQEREQQFLASSQHQGVSEHSHDRLVLTQGQQQQLEQTSLTKEQEAWPHQASMSKVACALSPVTPVSPAESKHSTVYPADEVAGQKGQAGQTALAKQSKHSKQQQPDESVLHAKKRKLSKACGVGLGGLLNIPALSATAPCNAAVQQAGAKAAAKNKRRKLSVEAPTLGQPFPAEQAATSAGDRETYNTGKLQGQLPLPAPERGQPVTKPAEPAAHHFASKRSSRSRITDNKPWWVV